MEPLRNNKRKWIVFGGVIFVLAVLIAIGPIIVAKRMKTSQKPLTAAFMIRVKGTVKKHASNNVVYLKGDNGLYYILIGDKLQSLLDNIDKSAIVFGNIVVPNSVIEGSDYSTIDGNPVRMRIDVVNFDLVE